MTHRLEADAPRLLPHFIGEGIGGDILSFYSIFISHGSQETLVDQCIIKLLYHIPQ